MEYGESERTLGELGVANNWRVVSKLPAVPAECTDVYAFVQERTEESLARLNVPALYALLLHRPEQLMGKPGSALYAALLAIKRSGLVRKIGVSVYGPAAAEQLSHRYQLDLVQLPFNVLDRRLVETGCLARLKARGIEVHTRSAFLQGLLLMKQHERPLKFQRWAPVWAAWESWLSASNSSAVEACLNFVLGYAEIDRVIVGLDGLDQLQQILAVGSTPTARSAPPLMYVDSDLIDPSRWGQL
jgi:aryl-alcohol dehydrogenase-like predicted oxidoreductase